MQTDTDKEILVHIPVDGVTLEGALAIPANVRGLVLFVHGSGSSRFSPRNNYVARALRDAGLGTLLIDLLTRIEDQDYERRFDIPLLTERVVRVTTWLRAQPETKQLALGYFGASTGAAAALQAAAEAGNQVGTVVSRGGRPDLAGAQALGQVRCSRPIPCSPAKRSSASFPAPHICSRSRARSSKSRHSPPSGSCAISAKRLQGAPEPKKQRLAADERR
jgi:pimeloyl-ACP methyl ester carboxylesterase